MTQCEILCYDFYFSLFDALTLKGEPCTEVEVEQLEKAIALPLPAAFRAYLLHSGKVPDVAFAGSDCAYQDLFSLREEAEKLLAENNHPFQLPKNAIVFWMHQGYQFFYFCADDKHDPAIYFYSEGNPSPQQLFHSFTRWLEGWNVERGAERSWASEF